MSEPTPEEMAALAVLAKNRRLMVLMVPEGATDEFCARLTSFTNLLLDLKMLPPLLVVARREGDGLHCPFCAVGIRADFIADTDPHDDDCQWRLAIRRWAYSQVQIDAQVAAGELEGHP